ncbi:MAG: hypothetical protein K9G46_03245 [Flavobacteriales bacterium]|nr:hypothetical protein [Flavobacteriales bacterium]
MKRIVFLLLPLALMLQACGSGQEQESSPEAATTDFEISTETYAEKEEASEVFEDGTHAATVYYNNSETGHSATYTLEVEVENNEVTTIYFESGGYLDSDHIQSAELDESGNATIYGEEGKTYEVQIDE